MTMRRLEMLVCDNIILCRIAGCLLNFHRCVNDAQWARVVTASHDKLRVYMRARRPPCLFYLDPLRVRVNKCLVLEKTLSSFFIQYFM